MSRVNIDINNRRSEGRNRINTWWVSQDSGQIVIILLIMASLTAIVMKSLITPTGRGVGFTIITSLGMSSTALLISLASHQATAS